MTVPLKSILLKLFLLSLIGLLFSCESVFMQLDPEDTPKENFDALWNTVNEKYSFFDYKNIDWDAVYSKYEPRIKEDMHDEELFDVLFGMLTELRDAHVNLWAAFNVARYDKLFLESSENFNPGILQRGYLKDDYKLTGALYNKKIDNIGYIYYSSFKNPILRNEIEYILQDFSETRGIIIDVRNNGGGNPRYGFVLASRFADKERYVFSTYQKAGPGRNDFTKENKVNIRPSGDFYYSKPVIILTNRGSYSATNDFVALMRTLPNVVLMGDTTGGGGGTPIGGELPNGWAYRFSATKTILPNGLNIEGGIPPDIIVDMDPQDELKGKDTILETAMSYIRKH